MFVRELQLYVDYLREQIAGSRQPEGRVLKAFREFGANLFNGIGYYKGLLATFSFENKLRMEEGLRQAELEIKSLLEKLQVLETA